jgi:starvation-inducible outer membrane lipoprotein
LVIFWDDYIDTEGIMIKKAAVVFTVMLLGGCVSAPDKAELSRADYGKLPDIIRK